MIRSLFPVLTLMWMLVALAPQFAAGAIINGGFELGLSGWTVAVQPGSGGDFRAHGSILSPISGTETVGPNSGSGFAIGDQESPTAAVLFQTFEIVGPATDLSISFSMFVQSVVNLTDLGVPAIGLDYTIDPSQHARVDLLRAGADPFTGDILQNLYGPEVDLLAVPGPNLYLSYTHPITDAEVLAGGTFMLRFAYANNQAPLIIGIDDVNIVATQVGVVPEPASCLCYLGMFACGAVARYRSAKKRRSAVPR